MSDDMGFNGFLVVVGYVDGKEPFRLLGRVSADTGEHSRREGGIAMSAPLYVLEDENDDYVSEGARPFEMRLARACGTETCEVRHAG